MKEQLIQVNDNNEVKAISVNDAVLANAKSAREHAKSFLKSLEKFIDYIETNKEDLDNASDAHLFLSYSSIITLLSLAANNIQEETSKALSALSPISPINSKENF